MVPRRRAPFRGNAQGNENGTRKQGGVSRKQRGGVSYAPLPLFAVVVRVGRPRPDDPNRASGEGRDGSAPPPFTAGAVRHVGGVSPPASRRVSHPPAAVGGVAPVICIPAGRLPGPRAGRTVTGTERRDG